ncbi:hypothetical protein F0562_035365 [Nyssa sinensis]|uniref:Uncharacterized protein n=1 Tax=Nyssa sinensis TaxID=561372 RepID=A0A5J5ADC6_9ASTE|nr:hypothetical protein F0562_035365 [Nyssa sinensis]
MQNSKNGLLGSKRSKYIEDERPLRDNLHNCNNEAGTSRTDDDLCSTAESSPAKKQTTGSLNSFSVPHFCPSSSEGKPLQQFESSDLKQPCQEEIDMEKNSGKDGAVED